LRNLKTSVLVDSGVRSVSLSMDRRSTLLEKIDRGHIEWRATKGTALGLSQIQAHCLPPLVEGPRRSLKGVDPNSTLRLFAHTSYEH
jgi:hypothetical protein